MGRNKSHKNSTARSESNMDTQAARFIKISEVLAIVGLSKSEVWRRIKESRFPAPIKLGERCTRFEEGEVQAWAAARLAERDAKPRKAA